MLPPLSVAVNTLLQGILQDLLFLNITRGTWGDGESLIFGHFLVVIGGCFLGVFLGQHVGDHIVRCLLHVFGGHLPTTLGEVHDVAARTVL